MLNLFLRKFRVFLWYFYGIFMYFYFSVLDKIVSVQHILFDIFAFGSWILDCRSIRSFCGSPKCGRLDLGLWILELGFWILDFGFTERFGFCIRLLLLYADSGRRIFYSFD